MRRAEALAQAACAAARQHAVAASEAMDSYLEEIRTLEIDLLAELVGSELKLEDFSRLETRLKQAENRAHFLADEHASAMSALFSSEQEIEEARTARLIAQSKSAKINEVVLLQFDAARVAAIATQDAEIDAFVETMGKPEGRAT